MFALKVTVQNSFGSWSGKLDIDGNIEIFDDAKMLSKNLVNHNLERLDIIQEDGTRVVFNKNIIADSVISVKVIDEY